MDEDINFKNIIWESLKDNGVSVELDDFSIVAIGDENSDKGDGYVTIEIVDKPSVSHVGITTLYFNKIDIDNANNRYVNTFPISQPFRVWDKLDEINQHTGFNFQPTDVVNNYITNSDVINAQWYLEFEPGCEKYKGKYTFTVKPSGSYYLKGTCIIKDKKLNHTAGGLKPEDFLGSIFNINGTEHVVEFATINITVDLPDGVYPFHWSMVKLVKLTDFPIVRLDKFYVNTDAKQVDFAMTGNEHLEEIGEGFLEGNTCDINLRRAFDGCGNIKRIGKRWLEFDGAITDISYILRYATSLETVGFSEGPKKGIINTTYSDIITNAPNLRTLEGEWFIYNTVPGNLTRFMDNVGHSSGLQLNDTFLLTKVGWNTLDDIMINCKVRVCPSTCYGINDNVVYFVRGLFKLCEIEEIGDYAFKNFKRCSTFGYVLVNNKRPVKLGKDLLPNQTPCTFNRLITDSEIVSAESDTFTFTNPLEMNNLFLNTRFHFEPTNIKIISDKPENIRTSSLLGSTDLPTLQNFEGILPPGFNVDTILSNTTVRDGLINANMLKGTTTFSSNTQFVAKMKTESPNKLQIAPRLLSQMVQSNNRKEVFFSSGPIKFIESDDIGIIPPGSATANAWFEKATIFNITNAELRSDTITMIEAFFKSAHFENMPDKPFINLPNVKNIDSCFYGSTSDEALPVDLLAGLQKVITARYTFARTNYGTIPVGFLDTLINLNNAANMFDGANVRIPAGLFAKCLAINNYSGCFSGGTISGTFKNLFGTIGSEPRTINYESCFRNATLNTLTLQNMGVWVQNNISYMFAESTFTDKRTITVREFVELLGVTPINKITQLEEKNITGLLNSVKWVTGGLTELATLMMGRDPTPEEQVIWATAINSNSAVVNDFKG